MCIRDRDSTADGFCCVLCKPLKKFIIQNKLIAQTYDGASVMSVEVNGLHARTCTGSCVNSLQCTPLKFCFAPQSI